MNIKAGLTDREGTPYTEITDVFSGLTLKTEEGNVIALCMRDDTVEINIMPKGAKESCWWRANMQTKEMERC